MMGYIVGTYIVSRVSIAIPFVLVNKKGQTMQFNYKEHITYDS